MRKEDSFSNKCYELLRKVPRGRVTSYKEIANALGTRAYRAVGNAMNSNPHSFLDKDTKEPVACHRVVNANGSLGGFAYGDEAKIDLLRAEGVEVRNGKILDFEKKMFRF